MQMKALILLTLLAACSYQQQILTYGSYINCINTAYNVCSANDLICGQQAFKICKGLHPSAKAQKVEEGEVGFGKAYTDCVKNLQAECKGCKFCVIKRLGEGACNHVPQ